MPAYYLLYTYIVYCVFLVDCWNGDNDEPVVYHGHTLVNKILFKDVMEAINENAFVTSQYVDLCCLVVTHCGRSRKWDNEVYLFRHLIFNFPFFL